MSHKVKDKVKVGPNDRCPCSSGLKYKKCCFRTAQQAKIRVAVQFDEMLQANENKMEIKSEQLEDLCTYFLDRYGVSSIDITGIVTDLTLSKINGYYGEKNIILICERNEVTESAFICKGAKPQDNQNIMIIYKNRFLQFNYDTEKDEAFNEMHKWLINKKSMPRV